MLYLEKDEDRFVEVRVAMTGLKEASDKREYT
jgi:hypothetical protein